MADKERDYRPPLFGPHVEWTKDSKGKDRPTVFSDSKTEIYLGMDAIKKDFEKNPDIKSITIHRAQVSTDEDLAGLVDIMKKHSDITVKFSTNPKMEPKYIYHRADNSWEIKGGAAPLGIINLQEHFTKEFGVKPQASLDISDAKKLAGDVMQNLQKAGVQESASGLPTSSITGGKGTPYIA